MARLKNKIAVITGGAGGIGKAAADRFTQEGAYVLLVDLDEQALRETVASIPSDAVSYTVADVTQAQDVERYVQIAVERYDRIDIFLNNAGIEGEINSIVDYSIESFDQVIAVNIRGVWLGLKYVIPVMKEQSDGSIIITSSTAGIKGSSTMSAYVTSKHAAIGMMRCAALECAPLGIRVNTVNPGPTETRMMRSIEKQGRPDSPEGVKEHLTNWIPMKRYNEPEDIANMMLFLASDESKLCTGGVYMVDGGVSAR